MPGRDEYGEKRNRAGLIGTIHALDRGEKRTRAVEAQKGEVKGSSYRLNTLEARNQLGSPKKDRERIKIAGGKTSKHETNETN